ncbi:MAG: molecular chaperone TorD family protein [Wolinella succinogenes]|uniref:TorD/DmsD family molecular chaperone n=1 Tax=Wolinella succinogenes TaxID=844 RepID=UPI0016AB6653|nr:molecular chaperone TorD family protein [Wolinella succinogenes]NLU33674.1 molecular chaperone TorD family protein [Wolinella succinogenes]
MDHANINKAREIYYSLLGIFLTYGRLEAQKEKAIEILEKIAAFPMTEEIVQDAKALASELRERGALAIEEEFDAVFINNLDAKAINLTASFYAEGQERGEKLLLTKDIITCTPKRKDESFVETEDNLGFLCTFLGYLVSDFEEKKHLELAKRLFAEVVNGYVDYVVIEILKHPNTRFYRHIARILESFAEFERLYLEIPAPKKEEFKDISEALRQEMLGKSKKRVKRDLENSGGSCDIGS